VAGPSKGFATPEERPTVGVIGLGYVGLPLAVAFAKAGCRVVGVDGNGRKVAALQSRRSYVEDVSNEDLAAIDGRFFPTTAYERLSEAEAVIICLPTPLAPGRVPDLSALLDGARSLAKVLRKGQLVVLESTTYPGTTREQLAPLLEESGLAAGRDFNLAYSPERIDPGRRRPTIAETPKVVGGLTDGCLERAVAVYRLICEEVVAVSSPEAAELTKLFENVFRSVNIALVNELALIAERLGIDVWEVIDAAATKPYGFMRFEPGPGLGGHCLPIDPFYLSWRAKQFDLQAEFIELAGKLNQQMPYHCVNKAVRALNGAGLAVKGSRVALIGVAYKGGVGDTRESPALKILALLGELGARLSYHDPHVPELPEFGLRSQPLDQVVAACDLAVITTVHPTVDHRYVVERAPLVLDLRGVTREVRLPHVVRL